MKIRRTGTVIEAGIVSVERHCDTCHNYTDHIWAKVKDEDGKFYLVYQCVRCEKRSLEKFINN
jgi:beta-xylosidase